MTTEKTAKPKAPAAAPVAAKKEAVIYIGPSLPRGQLHKNVTFRAGELPAHVQKMVDGNADLAALFVPASKLAQAQRNMADPASAESERVRRVIATFNKGEV